MKIKLVLDPGILLYTTIKMVFVKHFLQRQLDFYWSRPVSYAVFETHSNSFVTFVKPSLETSSEKLFNA